MEKVCSDKTYHRRSMASRTPLFRSCLGQVHPRAAILKRRQHLWRPEHFAYFTWCVFKLGLSVLNEVAVSPPVVTMRPSPPVFFPWMNHMSHNRFCSHTQMMFTSPPTNGLVVSWMVNGLLHSNVATAQNNGLTNGRRWGSNHRPCY